MVPKSSFFERGMVPDGPHPTRRCHSMGETWPRRFQKTATLTPVVHIKIAGIYGCE